MTPSPIANDLAEIVERLQGEEALDWEVKAARGGLPNAIWETISAFANTQGGWLILGVAEDRATGQRVVQGIADPETMIRQLHDQMRDSARISTPVCGASDITSLDVDGKRVIAVRVPPVSRRLRPVYTRDNPYRGTYVRRNEGDYPATRLEVDRMMRESSDIGSDQVILDTYSMSDLDVESLARYRRRFQTAQPASPHTSLDDRRFLTVIGGYGRDREAGREGITVAGLLMFGIEESIRSWRGRHLIDVRWYDGSDDEAEWTQRLVWEGNLFDAFQAIFGSLIKDFPVPFALVDGYRVDRTPQQDAVREALVNLLVHADYSERDASLVTRSADGLKFRNPGNSRVPDLDPSQGDRSDPRNPNLVRMFRFIGLAEEAGSGVPRIVRAWRDLGYEVPTFDVDDQRYEFTVRLRFAHLIRDEDRSWLESLKVPLDEDEQLALVLARHHGFVDNASLRQVTGRHFVDVTRVLGHLRDRELLVMIGAKRGARYELTDRLIECIDTADTADLPSHTEDLGTDTADLPSHTEDLGTDTADLPSDLASERQEDGSRLEALSAVVARTGKIDATKRDEIIVDMCAIRPLSIEELATMLDRSVPHMRAILRPLIKQGRIRYLYPAQPRSRQQRYTVSGESE